MSSSLEARLAALQAGDLSARGVRVLTRTIASGRPDVEAVGRDALARFGHGRALDSAIFPSIVAMERELLGTARDLLHGPGAAGTVTSGGAESILLALQTARDALPHVQRPVVVLPSSAHPSFARAAHVLGVERVVVPVDPVTHRADVAGTAAQIDAHVDRLVLVVASAPSPGHGVVDPVEELAAAAGIHGVRLHVDAGLGGWVLPWAEQLGRPVPPWDFRVAGVTSISVDLDAYGYAPQGVSLLLHSTARGRHAQPSTLEPLRPGGPVAAAWAVLQHLGADGYRDLTAATLSGVDELVAGVDAVPAVRVVAPPAAAVVSLATDATCDVFTLADELTARGWFARPQWSADGRPALLPLTLGADTARQVPLLLGALREAAAAAVQAGPVPVADDLRTTFGALDRAGLHDAQLDQLLMLAGLSSAPGQVTLPRRMAPTDVLLDAASPDVREALLVAFLDRSTR